MAMARTTASAAVLYGAPGHYCVPAVVQATQEEAQIFHQFRTKTASQIAGTFDQAFWTVHLLQATQVYAPVWHACNAMAAIAKRHVIPSDTSMGRELRVKYYHIALTQYRASISYLLKISCHQDPSPANKEALLMTTVLFMGLCSLRGDQKEASVHMRNGIKLFRQWEYWEEGGNRCSRLLPVQSLVALFNRLDSQSLNLLDDTSRLTWGLIDPYRNRSTAPFTSATEAYFEFELLLNGLLDLMKRDEFLSDAQQSNPLHQTRLAYRRAFDVWGAKFSNLQRSPLIRPSDAEAILILQVRQIAAEIALKIDVSEGEMCWDRFLPQFQRIVRISSQLEGMYHAPARNDTKGALVPRFSFAPTVCEPLYLVGLSCRDTTTRREAISLLKRCQRREGVWDTALAATTVESAMLMEEEGWDGRCGDVHISCECVPGSFICHSHRVVETDLALLGEGIGSVRLRTVHNVLHEQPGRTVRLLW